MYNIEIKKQKKYFNSISLYVIDDNFHKVKLINLTEKTMIKKNKNYIDILCEINTQINQNIHFIFSFETNLDFSKINNFDYFPDPDPDSEDYFKYNIIGKRNIYEKYTIFNYYI